MLAKKLPPFDPVEFIISNIKFGVPEVCGIKALQELEIILVRERSDFEEGKIKRLRLLRLNNSQPIKCHSHSDKIMKELISTNNKIYAKLNKYCPSGIFNMILDFTPNDSPIYYLDVI